MRILTRHLIRAHLGPFLFALSALTGLLFLNAVAQRMADLAGKGLTWDVILDFLVLSLPHTVALTLPMAVLVAVLHAFTEMAANNEITAMKAGGIPPQRILVPLLFWGAIMGAVMLFFNDRVLPEANHRLKNLLLDINRKSPTFVLREQAVNRVHSQETGQIFFISAERIDHATNHLEEVVIIDGADPFRRRRTEADSGTMAFNEARTDLYLTLYDGVSWELDPDRPNGFRQTRFQKQFVPLRGVGNELERRSEGTSRGDREMTLGMLKEAADEKEAALDDVVARNQRRTEEAVRVALGLELADSVAEAWIPSAPSAGGGGRAVAGVTEDAVTRRVFRTTASHQSQIAANRQAMNRYLVEYHKKITLAVACIVFVLLGVPLAIRFPRGGLGLVIAASSAIFAIYWVGLIAGEDLADRNFAPPGITMWIPNILFTALGLVLVKRMGMEAATNRGGGWDDLWWTVKSFFGRLFGKGRRPRGEVAAEGVG